MTSPWSERVLRCFSAKAADYSRSVTLQHAIAFRLAEHIHRVDVLDGPWIDLGSGSGLLADAISLHHPGRSVLRVDGSVAMLQQHSGRVETLHHDLALGLPELASPPALLASSFCLHWLVSPAQHLQAWCQALAPDGILALAVPIAGSFPQWHDAADAAEVPCTALSFPNGDALRQAVSAHQVLIDQRLRFTQCSEAPSELLRSFANIGADATQHHPLGGGAMRRLLRAWPRDNVTGQANLTWVVQLLLVRR